MKYIIRNPSAVKQILSKQFSPVSTVLELFPSFSYNICFVHLYVETPQFLRVSSLVEPDRSKVLEPAVPFCDTSGGAVDNILVTIIKLWMIQKKILL